MQQIFQNKRSRIIFLVVEYFRKVIFLTTLTYILCSTVPISAQNQNIYYGATSHPLVIESIEQLDSQVIARIKLTNTMPHGNFCLGEDVFVTNLRSEPISSLLKQENVPKCPKAHRFEKIGETLTFSLIFETVPEQTKYINITEDCASQCFRIQGIILDQAINQNIGLASELYKQNKLTEAVELMEQTLATIPNYPFGFLYFNLIHYNALNGDFVAAKRAYRILKVKNIIDKRNTISRLQAMEYYVKIM